jgi:sec-independent protein translocase protein TatA
MFGSIGMPELILIFLVALLVFGPKKLPDIGKSIGKGLAEFKKASDDLKKTIEQEMDQVKSEANAVKDTVAQTVTGPKPVEAAPAPTSEGLPAEPEPRSNQSA